MLADLGDERLAQLEGLCVECLPRDRQAGEIKEMSGGKFSDRPRARGPRVPQCDAGCYGRPVSAFERIADSCRKSQQSEKRQERT
jgi:hypothetical protein